jgi:hypothetical protein
LNINGKEKDYYISEVITSYFSKNKKIDIDKYDYWIEAEKICSSKGLRLPSLEEFEEIHKLKGTYGIPDVGYFWTDTLNTKT